MARKLVVGNVPRKVHPPTTVRPPTEAGSATLGDPVTWYEDATPGYEHDYPSGFLADDLLLLVVVSRSSDNSLTTHTVDDFTLVGNTTGGGTELLMSVYKRIADGTEATSITVDGSGGGINDMGSMMWYLSAGGVDFSSVTVDVAFGSSGFVDPPQITPTDGAGDYFVFPGFGWWSLDLDAPPTGYSFISDDDPTGAKVFDPRVTVASKLVTISTSEDPDAFGVSNTSGGDVVPFTIAVKQSDGTADVAAGNHTHGTDDVTDVATAANLGEILVSDGDSWETLTVGSDGQVLEADSGEALGVKWASSAGVTDHGALTGLSDDDHSQYTLADGSRAFTGDQSMGSNKLTNVTDPTAAQDAATKAYVDANVESGELLMQDGVTNPPVPIETEAQDDWLYEG